MHIRPSMGVAGAAALVVALSPAPALAAGEIRIATGQPGTSWHAFGAALAQRYNAAFPGSKAVPIPRGNGYWNPVVVNVRRAEFGLASAASAAWAHTGDETAYEKKKYTDIRVVMAGLRPVWIAAILHEEYIRNTGNSTLDRALRARSAAPRIVMEPFSSLVPIVADKILGSMGSSRRILRERGGDVLQVAAAQISVDDQGRARGSLFRGGRTGACGGAQLGARIPCALRRSAAERARRAGARATDALFPRSPVRARRAGGRNGRSRHRADRSPECREPRRPRDVESPDRRPRGSCPKPSRLAGLFAQPLRSAEDARRTDASGGCQFLSRAWMDRTGETGSDSAAPFQAAALNPGARSGAPGTRSIQRLETDQKHSLSCLIRNIFPLKRIIR